MIKAIKTLGLSLLVVFASMSCSKDDDPADNDIFVGTYEGSIYYADGDELKAVEEGSVRVVKLSGDTYNFNFSDGIPSLNSIKMTKGDNSTIFFSDGTLGTISISASKLTMNYHSNGKTWTADTTR